jgi:hypothetical protein
VGSKRRPVARRIKSAAFKMHQAILSMVKE